MLAAIELIQVSKQFPDGNHGLQPTSLSIEQGSFVTILGASGSGKSTMLKLINRLLEPTSGKLLIHGNNNSLVSAPKLRQKIGYVIQQIGLFPHMTIAKNIATVPEILGWPKHHIENRVNELLELVELDPNEFRDRYPRQLSGGQQQRVGLARALAGDPSILLMDEPFGAIDALTRSNLQTEILQIQQKLGKTIVFVTHDVQEALKLGSKVIVMRGGEVQQYDEPAELLIRPSNQFVQSLLGTEHLNQRIHNIPNHYFALNLQENIPTDAPRLHESHSLKEALVLIQNTASDYVAIENSQHQIIGLITLSSIKNAHKAILGESIP